MYQFLKLLFFIINHLETMADLMCVLHSREIATKHTLYFVCGCLCGVLCMKARGIECLWVHLHVCTCTWMQSLRVGISYLP